MPLNKIYFRADGSQSIGLGHVIRSLALLEMLSDHFDCYFIIQDPSEQLIKQICLLTQNIIVLPQSKDYKKEAIFLTNEVLELGDLVVLDGYNFDTTYQKILNASRCKLVCIDDIASYHFIANAIINHAPNLSPSVYSKEKKTQLYLGLNYALLRKPFQEIARKDRQINKIETLFICFGGADFNNLTYKAIENIALKNTTSLKKINVVIGSANIFAQDLEELIKKIKGTAINIYKNLSANEMVSLMRDSHLAIVPASSILYETIAVGMPIISGYYVDNQKSVYKGFNELGLIIGIDDFNTFNNYTSLIEPLINSEDSQHFVKLQKQKLFGQSKANFIKIFENLLKKRRPRLLKANQNDLLLYFNWANDSTVRKNAINQKPITLENHESWYKNQLEDSESYLFKLIDDLDAPIGQIRFNIKDNQGLIDYSIDKLHRGKGYGKLIIKEGLKKLFETRNKDLEVVAKVKFENIASCKIFEKLGFEEKAEEELTNTRLRCFSKRLGTKPPRQKSSMNIVIANSNPIHHNLEKKLADQYGAIIISKKQELTFEYLKKQNPKYIFFPHWSYIIPKAIHDNFTCIVFHMTDLPFGRGGSPLQNLITRGIKNTKISALKVAEGIDTGDIYMKQDLSLYGTAEEIFLRASFVIEGMIESIIRNNPTPFPQKGTVTLFKRRKPEQSNIISLNTLEEIYDYIRMLDAEGYPHAFIETENIRLEFSRASLKKDSLIADVRITKK